MPGIFTFGPTAMARIPLTPGAGTGNSGPLAEGVFLASRSLEAADPDSPQARRARTAYTLRARTRTTPHSVWCGVATARLDGHRIHARLGERHRLVTLPGPLWLHRLADRHLDTPTVLDALSLASNNLAVRRGDRFEAEHPGPSGLGQLGHVAATDLSTWLLTRCTAPTPAAQLVAEITARYPGATTQDARTALTHMVRTGLLTTDLLPEDLHSDPLDHLARRLPDGHPDQAPLEHLRSLLQDADRHPIGAPKRLGLLRDARSTADGLHHVEQPLTLDTLADADLHLPVDIGRRAAATASLLWRIGQRGRPLRAWTARFTDAYGPCRLVPLLEAIDPATGVGPPGPEDAIGADSDLDQGRAGHLARLLGDALAGGRSEIELTPHQIQRLEHAGTGVPPRTAEIHLRVALRADEPPLLIVGPHAGQEAGAAGSRFAHWLPELTGTRGLGAADAEIVCRPLTARTAALTPETGVCRYRIPVGVPPRPTDLRLADLAVAATGDHLLLWSHQLGRAVRPVLLSRITRSLLPPVAQLLHLLGHADERPWHTWSWGPAAALPCTPRVTHHGTVLSPQRWTVPHDLVSAAGNRTTWHARLADWRSAVRPPLPQCVVAEESDRLLLLDLGSPEQREILRRTVADGTRTVTEAIGYDSDQLPVQGSGGRHALELVVALRRAVDPAPAALEPRTAPRPRASDTLGPAQGWLSTAIAVPSRLQNQALRRLPPLPGARLAYWLRYQTPLLGPHLRLRARTNTPEDLAALQQALSSWAGDLTEQRLSDGLLHHQPYIRETQRYGGPDAIDHAEAFFAADSALAHAALNLGEDDRFLLAARRTAAIARTAGTPDAARPGPLTPDERRRRDALRAGTVTLPPHLTTLLRAHQQALAAFTACLAGPGRRRTASDLVHLHCNRLLGATRTAERIARSLALDLLHRDD